MEVAVIIISIVSLITVITAAIALRGPLPEERSDDELMRNGSD